MLLETFAGPWKKLKATNFTDTSFAARKSTLVEPTGDGVIALGPGAGQNSLALRFFGTDANNENFNARVIAWNPTLSAAGVPMGWDFLLLAQFAVTLGNLAGTADCAVTADDFEADTIELTYGNDDVAVSIVSPANDVRGAYALLDIVGCQKVEILFDRNSSAASANALYRKL